ncbi:GABA gated chloride channel RDL1-like protein, partial [Leptotrombidium deliense]
EPVNVDVTMYIIENKVIEETKTSLSFESNLYFRRTWNDSRLSFNGGEKILGSKDLYDKIWTPDLFFANSYDVQTFEVPNANVFVKISPEGNNSSKVDLSAKFVT